VGENAFIKLELCGESLGVLVQHKVQLLEQDLVEVLKQVRQHCDSTRKGGALAAQLVDLRVWEGIMI
jgi:hypothetical protein